MLAQNCRLSLLLLLVLYPTSTVLAQPAQSKKDDKLIAELQADFEELLKKEANPQPLRQAERFFEQTNQSDRWTAYGDALRLLRQHRSPAGIPLIMRYMIEHSSFGSFQHRAYVDTLVLLTGKDLEDPYRYVADRVSPVRKGVEKWLRTWWRANKGTFSTDISTMSEDQLQVITDRLLQHVSSMADRSPSGESVDVRSKLAVVFGRDKESSLAWYRDEVHPKMLPILLALAGYDPHAASKPKAWEAYEVAYNAVPLLAFLRANDGARDLHKIAVDEQQNSAVRLTCMLALYMAGEPLSTKDLTDLYAKEKKLERKLVIIYALAKSDQPQAATPLLVELLTVKNRYVQSAALEAVLEYAPPEALPNLEDVLKTSRDQSTIRMALRIVGKIRTEKAQKVLAEFLQEAVRGGAKLDYVYDALSAFEEATGQSFREAGAHPDHYYRQRAAEALAWWQKQNGR